METKRKKVVMVVDDKQDTLISISSILKKRGYDTITASSGKECLEKLKKLEQKPDLILLDIMMPEMSGIELLKQMKKGSKPAKINIAFLTAVTADKETKKKLKELGAEHFIEKPISADNLLEVVERLTK